MQVSGVHKTLDARHKAASKAVGETQIKETNKPNQVEANMQIIYPLR